MPKVTPYTDLSETNIRASIGSVLYALDITQGELADRLKMHPMTLSSKIKEPGSFRVGELLAIKRIAEKGGYDVKFEF